VLRATPATPKVADAAALRFEKIPVMRIGIAAGVVVILLILGLLLPSAWPLAVLAGVGLIVAAVMARPKSGELLPPKRTRGTNMQLPAVWDERQITLGMERYRGDRNLLGQYVDGIVARFVMHQDMHTMEVRTRFLETFNRRQRRRSRFSRSAPISQQRQNPTPQAFSSGQWC